MSEILKILVTDGGIVYKVEEGKNYSSVRGAVSHFATCPQAGSWRKK